MALLRMRFFRMPVRTPERLIVAPIDLRPVDVFVAEEILEGRFPLAGRELDTNGTSPFFLELPSMAFAARLHGFSWLRHLRAIKTTEASAKARSIVNQWLLTHGKLVEGVAWEPEIVAIRLIAWLSHSPVVLNGADSAFYRRFSRSLAVQGDFLERMVKSCASGETRFRMRIALAMLSVSVPASASAIRRAARLLDEEIDQQILPDGGHISRNPRTTLDLLLDLLPLRQTYMNLGHDMPSRLISGIDRMYPALRFFRHQDGDLALFNGATSTLANELMSVLRYDETAGQPFRALPQMNYQRMSAAQTTILMDTGLPLSREMSRTAHAGFLSFEMSSGRSRFIVNSGSPRFASITYRQTARSTAAHSTLVINETSSARLSSSGWLGHVMVDGPNRVELVRKEDEGGDDCIEASHDGYVVPFGLIHRRHIRLSRDGGRLSGRDMLVRADGSRPAPADTAVATVRFHVHPAIDLIQAAEDSVILKAPDGETWVFSVEGQEAVISEGIFFADASGIRSSEHIEISFRAGEVPEIDWQFIRHK
jgi:uncharacterized heparinase superfamily protein